MFAALFLPEFPLQARLRLSPAAQRPHALLVGEGRRAQVQAANSTARAAGVEPGLTMPLALARCPTLTFLPPSPAAEAEARACLHAAAWSLSPTIEDTASDLITIQLAALPADRHEPLARQALAQLQAAGLDARLGLAPTPLIAALAARQAEPYLRIEHGAAFLAPLPLAWLHPAPELAEVLRQWGIATLGAFRALPLAEVAQRFGALGVALWEAAGGGPLRPLQPVLPPLECVARHDCEQPVETLEPLLFLLRRLLDRLAAELSARHLAAGAATLVLRLDDGQNQGRDFCLPEPTTDPETVFRMLLSHLQTVRTAVPIIGLELRLAPTRPRTQQHGLFDATLRDPHGFTETLARLAAIVGSTRVGTPTDSTTHHPDRTAVVAPASAIPPPTVAYAPPTRGLLLRRYRPAHPARITLMDTRPAHLASVPARGVVRACQGPWRTAGEWWRPESTWRREEWDVELAEGGLYRLLRVGEDWFVEGEYD